jgi:hypothetical protein
MESEILFFRLLKKDECAFLNGKGGCTSRGCDMDGSCVGGLELLLNCIFGIC